MSIEAGEKRAVLKALKNNQIPTPDSKTWKAIVARFPEAKLEKFDGLLSVVTLPTGWNMKLDSSDKSGRRMLIVDNEDKQVGSIFLKDTPYERKGYTYFEMNRLRELGVDIE